MEPCFVGVPGRMAGHLIAICLGLVVSLIMATTAWADALTLEQAFALAEQNNPAYRAAQASLIAARGELEDARSMLWNNPHISTEVRRRNLTQIGGPSENLQDGGIGLSQTFEIAGQRGARRGAAEQTLAALQQSLEDLRRELRAEVEQRFVQVISLQARIDMEGETRKLIADAAAFVKKRVQAGEDSRLDGNLAVVELERANNQLAQLGEQLIGARSALAAALQLPAELLPEAVGTLDPASPRYGLDQLLESATNRPRLRALDHRESAAMNRLDLERASVYPDVTLGVNRGIEKGVDTRDNITIFSISLPLPLFRRNAAGIGRATTELTQTQIEKQALHRDIRAQVLALRWRLGSLKARVERLIASVLPSLEENQRLSAKALQAGEIALPQLLLVGRQVLDGRRDLLNARTELRLTQVALEATAGWSARESGEPPAAQTQP